MHTYGDYQAFLPDPAAVRSEYRLKEIIAEFEQAYQKNCARLCNKSLSHEDNTRLVNASDGMLI